MSSGLLTVESENAGSPNAVASGAWGDWIGMVASIGCAIHCAAMPFVIAYLPALGLSFLADEAFHKWMAVACFLIAVTAFIPGFRKHGRLTPVIIASVGLVMISFAAFGLAGECCPSCASAALDGSAKFVAAAETPACTDANCPSCAATDTPASTSGSAPSPAHPSVSQQATPLWLTRVAPWLTPIGGVVLVSAHLLNRRYGCLCGCCGSASSTKAGG